jgi:dTDP-4-amino-4,6-dideoxygalactose transaminase
MLTLNDRKLAYKMENIWAFSGESPTIMTLNWRMNEMTAAVGLAQLERVDDIVQNYYNKTLKIYNDAIEGCSFLQKRTVPKEAVVAGYWFACTWQGDKMGMSYDRFKQLAKKMGIGLRFGFNQVAPYQYDFFKNSKAYGRYKCPVLCPHYVKKSDYRYERGLCPVVEDVMPRLVTVSLIFKPIEDAKRDAEKLRKVIEIMER